LPQIVKLAVVDEVWSIIARISKLAQVLTEIAERLANSRSIVLASWEEE
jgi:hypothetical protein